MSRRHKKRQGNHHDVELPITPMLDMSFQLLFFYICSYKPPTSQEVQLPLNLLTKFEQAKQEENRNAAPADPSKPPDINPEVPPYNLKIEVEARFTDEKARAGETEMTIVKFKVVGISEKVREVMKVEGVKTEGKGPIEIDIEKEDLKKLVEVLKQAHLPPGSETPEKVQILSTGKLRWGQMVAIMDACHQANFKTVGFSAPPEKR